jgi:S1-C subfamily serine protease
MVRDREEWRRPWTAGSTGLPGSGRGAGSVRPRATTSVVSPLGDVTAFEGAFDLVSDAAPRSGTYGRASLRDGSASSDALATVGARPALAPPAPVAAARRPGGTVGLLVGALLAGAVGAALTLVAFGATPGDLAGALRDGGAAAPATPSAPATGPATPSTVAPASDPIPAAAELVLPSVVRVNVSSTSDLTRFEALGSGVIYRSDGYIITNNHVIENGVGVEVLFSNGDRYQAEIVGRDEQNDLALLKVDRTGLPAIAIRPAEEPPRVGETVIAIGSPFGLDATVTAGIISAVNRNVSLPGTNIQVPNVVQTDAAINRGNSGGALVDLQGRLIGINTLIQTESGGNQGVGFAVSAQQAVVSSDQLIEKGFVSQPLLGITGTDISAEVAAAFGLPDRRGAVVETVVPGSGAAEAGLLPGDIIIAVDGRQLVDMSQLVAEVRRRAPGTVVVFDVLRAGDSLRVEAVLKERPRD